MLLEDPYGISLVLLDRMMPRMDGMEVLCSMRDHPRLRYTPVILQTAKVMREDVLEGMRAGARHYLRKPFKYDELMAAVRSALAEHDNNQMLLEHLQRLHSTAHTLDNGTFRFRTLDEARQLAGFLSHTCPDHSRVAMGLTELGINAVEHGIAGIDYGEKSELLGKRSG